MSGRRRDERGQTAALMLGFLGVVILLVVVVVDASAAYLRRQSLSSLADGAALAAADGLQGEHVYTSGLGERATIDPSAAESLVAEHLESLGTSRDIPGLRWAVETRGERVVVRVAAPLDLPFALPGVGDTARVTATAAAVVVVTG